jgi:hypothetical protein
VAAVQQIFGALAAGMITFTGIIFSAVFAAAQIQTSSYSPRLAARLRRDPVVMRAWPFRLRPTRCSSSVSRAGADRERGTLRVVDAIFVCRDEAGTLEAIAVHGDGAGRMVAPLLDFRLDASKRRRATERALGGDRGAAVRSLSAELDRGESTAVVLIEPIWPNALEDAVARTGGTPVASEFVEATAPAELSAEST